MKVRLAAMMFLLLLSLIVSTSAIAQSKEKALVYDILYRDEKIGTVVAVQMIQGGITVYRIETHSEIRVIIPVKVHILVKNTFSDEVMTEGYIRKEVNGSVKTHNSVLWNNTNYDMINKGGDTVTYRGKIMESVSELYFSEPVTLQSVFSEMFLEQLPLEKTGQATYRLSMPDGNTNYYMYKDGICTEAIVETDLTTVRLKLKSSSDGS